MDRGDFEVVTQVGARRRQGQARPRWLALTTLARKPVDRQMLLVVEVMIQTDDAI